MMTEKGKRAAYTLEFKLEAVRLVQGGLSFPLFLVFQGNAFKPPISAHAQS